MFQNVRQVVDVQFSRNIIGDSALPCWTLTPMGAACNVREPSWNLARVELASLVYRCVKKRRRMDGKLEDVAFISKMMWSTESNFE